MRRFNVSVFFLCIVFCCQWARAQKTAEPGASAPQHQENPGDKSAASSQAAQPAAELQGLVKALSGKWALKVKFEPSPEMPNGFAASGEETWRPGPGGFTLLEEERLPTPSRDVFLLGVIWWDSQTKSLKGMECNNQLPYTCDLKGGLNDITLSWDGKQFTIEEWETHGSKKTLWHEAWSDITPTSFTQTGDVRQSDGSSTRLFTMRATKIAEIGN